MTFEDPRWLWGLALLPLLALLEWRAAVRARKALATLVGTRPDHALLAQRRPGERRTGAALRLLALALLVAGAARPEWGREVVRRAATGSDVVLVVDVSASMDVRDVPPSRLAEARREALAVVDQLGGSRIGVLAFAGDAVRLCPLTLDRGTARLTLEGLSSGAVSEPGTDLGKALRAAMKLMPGGRREEQAIVLWTDGEDLERGGRAAIDDVQRSGIRVFAVGVGTPSGDVVPTLDDGGRTVDVKRDEQGHVVRSRLDEDLLRTLARRTHGGYFAAQRPGGELPRLLGALGGLARSGRGQRSVERPVARFPLFAALAAVALAFERLRPRRRRTNARAAEPAAVGAAALLLALALTGAAPARAQSAWARGDAAWKRGAFTEAESLYALRLRRGAPDEVRVNRATARARSGGLAEAEAQLGALADRTGRIGREARFGLGTVQAQQRREDEALATLRHALERDPSDEDARWNYELLLRRREQRRQQQQQQSQGGGGGADPQPQPQGGGPKPGQPSPQAPPTPAPSATPPDAPPRPQPAGGPPRMDRAQADRLLNALQDLARLEQQRSRRVPVTRERRGKDW
jgi:Ca-activated chloride channel homolog